MESDRLEGLETRNIKEFTERPVCVPSPGLFQVLLLVADWWLCFKWAHCACKQNGGIDPPAAVGRRDSNCWTDLSWTHGRYSLVHNLHVCQWCFVILSDLDPYWLLSKNKTESNTGWGLIWVLVHGLDSDLETSFWKLKLPLWIPLLHMGDIERKPKPQVLVNMCEIWSALHCDFSHRFFFLCVCSHSVVEEAETAVQRKCRGQETSITQSS